MLHRTNQRPVIEEAAREVVPTAVPNTDRDHFVQMVLAELDNLYEGNALRFGLRPLEVAAWRAAFGK